MSTGLFDELEVSESESVGDEREGRERAAQGSPRRAVVEPARGGAEPERLEGGGGGNVINGGTIEDEEAAVIGGEGGLDDNGGDDGGKTNPTPQVQCGQEPAPAPEPQVGKGKWSKHCSARLIHAVHDRQSALATIATGKSRSQIDAGENPWDTVAELWNNPEYKPETDTRIRDEIGGGRHSPNPALGRCGRRSGPELKKKFAEMKASMTK